MKQYGKLLPRQCLQATLSNATKNSASENISVEVSPRWKRHRSLINHRSTISGIWTGSRKDNAWENIDLNEVIAEMKEMEKNVMCVLLQRLVDKNLITPKVHDNAKEQILDTLDWPESFCYCEEKREGGSYGHTQDSG